MTLPRRLPRGEVRGLGQHPGSPAFHQQGTCAHARSAERYKRLYDRYRDLYRQVRAHRDRLRVLSARSIHAREEEAKRIARELHDETGQITASVHLALDEIARRLAAEDRQRLQKAKELLDGLEERLRIFAYELRPAMLDDLGLLPALEQMGSTFSARTGIPVAVEGWSDERLDPRLETGVYRIVQEALTNVARHAQAQHARVLVRSGRAALRCAVADDGTGFDVEAALRGCGAGLGLLGIQERVDALCGRMEISSSRRRGTELKVTLPLRRS